MELVLLSSAEVDRRRLPLRYSFGDKHVLDTGTLIRSHLCQFHSLPVPPNSPRNSMERKKTRLHTGRVKHGVRQQSLATSPQSPCSRPHPQATFRHFSQSTSRKT